MKHYQRGSEAEIDYIISQDAKIIPIEIKSYPLYAVMRVANE